MKIINLLGNFNSSLGIPQHTRELALGLENIGVDVIKKQIIDDGSMPKNEKPFDTESPGLIFWYPDAYAGYNVFPKTLGYFIFEYTKIHPYFVQAMNELDGICTASKWGAKVLAENGVTVPVHVVPGGVNTKTFNPAGRALPKDVYRFLHVGKCEERKSTRTIIEAFNIASKGDPNIRLSLAIDNPHIQGFSAEKFLQKLSAELQFGVENIDIVHHVQDINVLYKTSHCAIFAPKAEGIGLPIVESIASGLPTITTLNSGITEYATDDNALLLRNSVEEPIYDPYFFPRKGEFGTWMAPNLGELINKIRWVLSNREEAAAFGLAASENIKSYSWENAAKALLEVI